MKINKHHLKKFEENVFPMKYHRRGVLFSEAFAVCALSDLADIDLLIESGIANGVSTEIFAKYGIKKIIGVERAEKEKEQEMFLSTQKRLEKYSNVSLIQGDSFSVLPKLLRENADKKVALVIDGPKGKLACKLLKKCMSFKNVVFGAIHDQRKREMDKFFTHLVYTNQKTFRNFDYLDKEIGIKKPVYGITLRKNLYVDVFV